MQVAGQRLVRFQSRVERRLVEPELPEQSRQVVEALVQADAGLGANSTDERKIGGYSGNPSRVTGLFR